MMQYDPREEVRKLLEGLSDLEVRELCIKALRHAHKGSRLMGDQFQMHGHLGKELLPLLAGLKKADLKGQLETLKEAFGGSQNVNALDQPWMHGVFEFVVWFTRAGLAWPLGAQANQTPITLRLTAAGVRLLQADEDHPHLPGFVDRVVKRCPGLPDSVVSLLAQSRDCLSHGLMQPAVSLMGVAYETAVEEAADVLVAKGKLSPNAQWKAAMRISAVKAVIDNILPTSTPQERDDRFAAHAAFDFAHQLRRRRNDASHTKPTYGFEDREEAEELLVSAGRHLPNLWRVAR